MSKKKGISSLFTEFLSVYRCHVGHVLVAAPRKGGEPARASETRELGGAFKRLTETRNPKTAKDTS